MPFDDRFEERPVRTTAGVMLRGWVLAIFAVVLVGIICIGLWAFGVFSSDIRGQGNAEIIKNEARNRIRAQEGFETRFAEIQASDRNIIITAEALRGLPGDRKLSQDLLGLKQYCNGLVGDYNAESRKFTAEDFRSADLPYKINMNDVTTDCKE